MFCRGLEIVFYVCLGDGMNGLKLNSKVDIFHEDGSRIQATLHDMEQDLLVISVLQEGKDFKLLHVGEQLELAVYQENQLICFEGRVKDRQSGTFMLYHIKPISPPKKFQRREWVRVPFGGIVLFCTDPNVFAQTEKAFQDRNDAWVERDHCFKAIATDLSGGGLNMKTHEKLMLGQELLLNFALDGEPITTKGQIRHFGIEPFDGEIRYRYGIAFKDISEQKMEKIIGHVFLLMRRNKPV